MTVPGTDAAALIVPSLAASLTAVLDQRKLLAGRIGELLEAYPLSKVLTSMPGGDARAVLDRLREMANGKGTAFTPNRQRDIDRQPLHDQTKLLEL